MAGGGTHLNPRLVVCMFGGMLCGMWRPVPCGGGRLGLPVGLALYSGVGSVALVVLAVALPQRVPSLRMRRRPALA